MKFDFQENGYLAISTQPVGSDTFYPYLTVPYWTRVSDDKAIFVELSDEEENQLEADWFGIPEGVRTLPFFHSMTKNYLGLILGTDGTNVHWHLAGNSFYTGWLNYLRSNGIEGLEGEDLQQMQLLRELITLLHRNDTQCMTSWHPSSTISLLGKWVE